MVEQSKAVLRLRSFRQMDLVVLVVALALLLFTAATGTACRAGAPSGGTPASGAEEEPAREFETVVGAVGEPIYTESFAIEVVGVRAAALPPEAGEPDEGLERVTVIVSMVNTGNEEVALNAVPYAVQDTLLEVDGTEYPGMLVSGIISDAARRGVVAVGEPTTRRFLYDIPLGSREATFMWPPVAEAVGYPKIVVPLPADSFRVD